MKDWITPEWLCTLASETGGGIADHGGHGVPGVQRLPGHKDVDPNCYETEAAIAFAEAITEALGANTFVFDASDLMPPDGPRPQRSFWDGMVNFAQGTLNRRGHRRHPGGLAGFLKTYRRQSNDRRGRPRAAPSPGLLSTSEPHASRREAG